MVSQDLYAQLHGVVVKRRGKAVLGPLDLDLRGGGFTIVLGPNGAGKTTFLKVLHGVDRHTSGSVTWSVPTKTVRQGQAYVFQRPIMLHQELTVVFKPSHVYKSCKCISVLFDIN